MSMPAEALNTPTSGSLTPVTPKDRIFQLDMLRGWAILGILAVNAMAFAWPMAAEMATRDPFGHTGGDAWGQWAVDVFFQDKFRTLFTMLFGVSVFLVGGERQDRDRGRLLRRRLFWLAVFGLIHGIAIWYGDILLHYASCGLVMLLVRSWSPGRLLWAGGSISAIWMLFATATPLLLGALGPEFSAKMAAGSPQVTMEQINAAVAAYQVGGMAPWIENLKAWATLAVMSLFLIPVSVPLMMVGLGLFKSGFLTGRAPVALYILLVGIAAAILAVDAWASAPGRVAASLPINGLDSAAGGMAPLITIGYISMLLLFSLVGLRVFTDRLVPVGRMAFTNYLTQSLIMASVFYLPGGPEWMGTLGPAGLWPIVIAIWALQLIWSPLWLSAFQMGPLEWAWRCLTYGRLVPIRK
ncbi:DUF418 domain-containing protein [Brevundimonas sp. AJA228-03]|uniref:DUF418 domain-containing protein n=1 Tax=Brevundimonas sp. AJA228-03 TaxID=2752515 RepID=UPI001AE0A44B|nr:DUF418 domain-containing protein [Brevundimonas sp. AJA228-03]QTN20033.1 DUF418 domain-containing protein [Brevundimonas sp. AJA228-03]